MELYHILNRGVDKRKVVIDDHDRLRFVHSLFIFNDKNILDQNHSRFGTLVPASSRDLLVQIHAWCLMDNHYHLLISAKDDDTKNISRFMKRLNMGYARYFNDRHGRSGYLWQGKYKKIHIERDSHFLYIPYYIHLNPLDYKMKEWRSGGVEIIDDAIKNLSEYRWSSYLDYQNVKNFPSVLDRNLIADLLGDNEKQYKSICSIITTKDHVVSSEYIEK